MLTASISRWGCGDNVMDKALGNHICMMARVFPSPLTNICRVPQKICYEREERPIHLWTKPTRFAKCRKYLGEHINTAQKRICPVLDRLCAG